MRHSLVLLSLCALLFGCETTETIKSFNDARYYRVEGYNNALKAAEGDSNGKIRCEEELQESGPKSICYVEHSLLSQFKLHPEIIYEVPKSLVIDAGNTVLIVAGTAMYVGVFICPAPTCTRAESSNNSLQGTAQSGRP